tara:strand:+ start:2783 stop:2926 length:144 start_codon:yes stop_codon:yes gene_type:complete
MKVNEPLALASNLMQGTRMPAYFKTTDAFRLFVKQLAAAKAVSREVL